MFSTISAYIQITRPFYKWFIAVSSVTSAMVFAVQGIPPLFDWFLAILIFGLFGQPAFRLINDYFDYEIDSKQNKDPYGHTRQIVKGNISKNEALTVGLALHLIGLILSILFFSTLFTLMFITFISTSFAYSIKLKKIYPLNTISISIGYGLWPMVAGYSHFGNILEAPLTFWAFFVLIGILGAGSSNTKDLTDVKGDTEHGVKNMVTMFGEKKTRELTAALILIPYFILPILIFIGIFPLATLGIGILGIIMAVHFIPKVIDKEMEDEKVLPTYLIHNIIFIFIFPLLVFL